MIAPYTIGGIGCVQLLEVEDDAGNDENLIVQKDRATSMEQPDYRSLSDEELLHLLTAFDDQAAKELHRRHERRVMRVVSTAEDEAEDVAQEVWLDVYLSIRTFRIGSSVEAWICGIARNKLFDYLRRRARRLAHEVQIRVHRDENGTLHEIEIEDFSVHIPVQECDTDNLLNAAIDSLPPAEKSALLLTVIHRLPEAEAAECLGTSLKRIKEYRSRAYLRIAKLLREVLNLPDRDPLAPPGIAKSQRAKDGPVLREPESARHPDLEDHSVGDNADPDKPEKRDSELSRKAGQAGRRERVGKKKRNEQINRLLLMMSGRGVLRGTNFDIKQTQEKST